MGECNKCPRPGSEQSSPPPDPSVMGYESDPSLPQWWHLRDLASNVEAHRSRGVAVRGLSKSVRVLVQYSTRGVKREQCVAVQQRFDPVRPSPTHMSPPGQSWCLKTPGRPRHNNPGPPHRPCEP